MSGAKITSYLVKRVKSTVLTNRKLINSSAKAMYSTRKGNDNQNYPFNKSVSLVIFDKDGTLVEFGAGWTEATINFTKRLEMASGMRFGNKVLDFHGYDSDKKMWREGLLCDDPDTIRVELHGFLQKQGLNKESVTNLLRQHYRDDHFVSDYNTLQEIDNPLAIFKTLNYYNIKVAICTADSRLSTYHLFSKVNLAKYTDYILCGDDQHFQTKPNPKNIYHICDELKVSPAETVMIGDTMRDVQMGKTAQVHTSIGVLSGVCEKHELSDTADVIVPSLKHSMEFYLPTGHEEIYQKYCES